jgi:hypothetical protein
MGLKPGWFVMYFRPRPEGRGNSKAYHYKGAINAAGNTLAGE